VIIWQIEEFWMKQRKTQRTVPTQQIHPKVQFVPPSAEAIEQYARSVSEKLAQHDPAYSSFEIRSGLAGYLKIVACIASSRTNAVEERVEETHPKQPRNLTGPKAGG
jgi:hypothetical protein